MDGVKILAPDLRSTEQSSANPVAVLERRANFARAYIARGDAREWAEVGSGPCVASWIARTNEVASLKAEGDEARRAGLIHEPTARPTSQAGAKAGHSDPVVLNGRAIAQRIKGTPGITG